MQSVDLIAWRRLPVSSRNVAIYISSDYIVRQTIINFIIASTTMNNNNLFLDIFLVMLTELQLWIRVIVKGFHLCRFEINVNWQAFHCIQGKGRTRKHVESYRTNECGQIRTFLILLMIYFKCPFPTSCTFLNVMKFVTNKYQIGHQLPLVIDQQSTKGQTNPVHQLVLVIDYQFHRLDTLRCSVTKTFSSSVIILPLVFD